MAARKSSKSSTIDPDDIDLLGKRKDAQKLAKYVEQAGEAAVPLLKRAFTEGSVDMRAAAAAALGQVAPAVGEELVIAALDALPRKKPPKKELAALLACLGAIGTDGAVEALMARVPPLTLSDENIVAFPADARAKLLTRVIERIAKARSDDDATAILEAFDLPDSAYGLEQRHAAAAHAIYVAIVDDARFDTQRRSRAADLLLAVGDAKSRAAIIERAELDVVRDELVIEACIEGDPGAAFDRLAPIFRAQPMQRYTITRKLNARADARWRQLALDIVDDDAGGACLMLAKLGAANELLAIASRAELDTTTKSALAALGSLQPQDPRAGALLVRVLSTPAGTEVAPLLLTALSQCGGTDELPALEKMLASAGSRAGFFNHAIAAIRARHAAA